MSTDYTQINTNLSSEFIRENSCAIRENSCISYAKINSLHTKKGFISLEYILIFLAVVVGVLYMAIYLRRSIQGSLRGAGEDIGSQLYLSGAMDSEVTQELKGNITTNYLIEDEGEKLTTTTITNTDQTYNGYEYILKD